MSVLNTRYKTEQHVSLDVVLLLMVKQKNTKTNINEPLKFSTEAHRQATLTPNYFSGQRDVIPSPSLVPLGVGTVLGVPTLIRNREAKVAHLVLL